MGAFSSDLGSHPGSIFDADEQVLQSLMKPTSLGACEEGGRHKRQQVPDL